MNRIAEERLAAFLENSQVDAVLISDPYNLRYISGFRGGEGMLFISGKQKVLITDSRYTEAAGKESDFTVIEENASHVRSAIIRECLEKEGGKEVGYEDQFMRCSDFGKLQKKLPEVSTWKPLGGSVDALRRIKTKEELVLLEKAEAIGDAAFSDILNSLRPGMTEKEVAAELEYSMKKHGADNVSFSTIIASGIHSSMPHAIPTDKQIVSGDFVTMDFGCIYEGYCSDMTRTIVVGKASDRQKEIYRIVLEAQTACLEGLRAGMTGKEGDALARNVINRAGFGQYFGHGTGHSVGLYIHEEPRLSPLAEKEVLCPGMIETVEPGIYIPGFGGVRIEDMVVIEEDGIRDLAASPKNLIELN